MLCITLGQRPTTISRKPRANAPGFPLEKGDYEKENLYSKLG